MDFRQGIVDALKNGRFDLHLVYNNEITSEFGLNHPPKFKQNEIIETKLN